jgi:hypothetical protein
MPREGLTPPPKPDSAAADQAAARRLIAEDEQRVLIRYFDVKDLVVFDTDELIAEIRRDVMPDEWARDPAPVIEGRNRILITRGPRFLLDGIEAYLKTKRKQKDEAGRLARVVQIHAIADLVVGEGGRAGTPPDSIPQGIREASKAGEWPGWQHADVRLVGSHNLVVKAEPAFQEAVDAHLTSLRESGE